MRPEASIFLLGYALWWFWRGPRVARGIALLAGLVIVPVGWVVPPGLSRGHFLEASQHARAYAAGHLSHSGPSLFVEVLKRATQLTDWPVLVAALVLTVLAVRARDRVVLSLAGVSLGYVAIVEAMTLDGYPGLSRFMLPAAAVACVLAAVGVVRLASLAGGGLASLAAVGLVVAVAVPSFDGALRNATDQNGLARTAVSSYDELAVAAHRVGGVRRILPCPTSSALINHTAQTGFAWMLGVPLTRVRGVTDVDRTARRPGLAFFGPRNVILGGAPSRLVGGLRGTQIDRYRIWRVIRVTRPGDRRADRCVGS